MYNFTHPICAHFSVSVSHLHLPLSYDNPEYFVAC